MTFAELTDRASLITWIDELLAEANPERDFTFGAKDYKRLVRWQSRQAAYKVHTIQKRSGGERTIHAPGKRLKSVLSVLNHALQAELTGKHALAACVIGFVPGRSIVDGAREHCRRRFVFNTDLEDFFPSVELHRIKACLTLAPFNLKDARATETAVPLEPDALHPDGAELIVTEPSESLAFELANLFTVPMTVTRYSATGAAERIVRPVLPQGAPTSPTITNIVCRKLDRRLQGLAKRHGLRYTRYADDLTFSSDHDAYAPDGPFRQQLNAIIEDEGFRQNLSKVRLQRDTERQMVTGLVVNDRVNVVPGYVKDIHNLLRIWKNEGLEEAQKHYLNLRDERGRTKSGAAAKPSAASGSRGHAARQARRECAGGQDRLPAHGGRGCLPALRRR